jgi:hypothetical protein
MTKLEDTARQIVHEINQFDHKCEEEEYTDTGIVWELLCAWRAALLAAIENRPASSPAAIDAWIDRVSGHEDQPL